MSITHRCARRADMTGGEDRTQPDDSFAVGSWAFSREQGEPVRILESQTVWRHTNHLVWIPSRNSVAWVAASALVPTDKPKPQDRNFDRLISTVAAARIAEGL